MKKEGRESRNSLAPRVLQVGNWSWAGELAIRTYDTVSLEDRRWRGLLGRGKHSIRRVEKSQQRKCAQPDVPTYAVAIMSAIIVDVGERGYVDWGNTLMERYRSRTRRKAKCLLCEGRRRLRTGKWSHGGRGGVSSRCKEGWIQARHGKEGVACGREGSWTANRKARTRKLSRCHVCRKKHMGLTVQHRGFRSKVQPAALPIPS